MTHFLIAAGGTGGHVLPAITLTRELLASGIRVTFLTDKRGLVFIDEALRKRIALKILPVVSLRGGIFGKVRFYAMLLWALVTCMPVVKRGLGHVIGFSGYPTFAPLALAWLQRIPYSLQEQNMVLGRVNRLFFKGARFVFWSFLDIPASKRSMIQQYSGKIIPIGVLVRQDFYSGLPLKQVLSMRDPAAEFRMLVTGGSQGAHFFSELLPDALAQLPGHLRQRINLVHQARPEDCARLRERYRSLGLANWRVAAYFHDMAREMRKADFLVMRAGANTCQEVIQLGKCCLFIPLPGAMDDHQYVNAQSLHRRGAGLLWRQTHITSRVLCQMVAHFIVAPRDQMVYGAQAYAMRQVPPEKEVVKHLISV